MEVILSLPMTDKLSGPKKMINLNMVSRDKWFSAIGIPETQQPDVAMRIKHEAQF